MLNLNGSDDIVYNTICAFMDFVHLPELRVNTKKKFRKLDLFPSSGEGRETPTLLGPLESVERVSEISFFQGPQ
jgi:hypothetical protein